MKSLWNDKDARVYARDPLQMRVYSSRLLGQEPALVLHGGGNTSVKATARDLFGEEESVLYVKGSGWDLATIEAPGFAAVKLDALKKMVELEALSDTDMVSAQRAAMMDPSAPNPSVEAILHAIIPFTFVDHTHTDALVTLTNTAQGESIIREIYGDRVLVIPYVMPGFLLSRMVHELSKNADWSKLEGLVLMNHGLFSFAEDAKTSYERMIQLVTEAEDYLVKHKAMDNPAKKQPDNSIDLEKLACLRKQVSNQWGKAIFTRLSTRDQACGFASLEEVHDIATRGPLTPDHVIRTKQVPLLIDEKDIVGSVHQYGEEYVNYFQRQPGSKDLTCLDSAPRWAVWPGQGTVAFGKTLKEANIIADITRHTIKSIQWAEALGGWKALPESDIFEVEYWELEQAKLGKSSAAPMLQGQIALVTGAASGIGKACAQALSAKGAAVLAVDINPEIKTLFQSDQLKGFLCDVTKSEQLEEAVQFCVREFGGLDLLVNNAGIFPPSATLDQMDASVWDKSMAVNLTSQQRLLQYAAPFLKQGVDPSVIFIASKNVPAPGPGAGAYSVAKAGVTQMARVAALELGEFGIRVNTIHPNAVFDTAIWSDEILETRAKNYGLTVEEYKTNNVLKTEIGAADVAELVCSMAGPAFSKTTGAQVPIDGGNERVI